MQIERAGLSTLLFQLHKGGFGFYEDYMYSEKIQFEGRF